jgi:hypothetical protein
VCHRTVSGAPGEIDFKLFTFEFSGPRSAIIHRTIRCATWKLPRGGMNRRKLKFTNLKHNYKPVLALEIYPSSKERVKTNHKKMKRMTQWFVLPRFGSWEPSLHWGGHKDPSFNPFPLSNGHLDRVSFLPWFPGSLRPHKDHHTIGISCFAYKALRVRMRKRRKPTKQQEQQKNTSWSSHKS